MFSNIKAEKGRIFISFFFLDLLPFLRFVAPWFWKFRILFIFFRNHESFRAWTNYRGLLVFQSREKRRLQFYSNTFGIICEVIYRNEEQKKGRIFILVLDLHRVLNFGNFEFFTNHESFRAWTNCGALLNFSVSRETTRATLFFGIIYEVICNKEERIFIFFCIKLSFQVTFMTV